MNAEAPRQQYGVLPYRLKDGRPEVLLVTSRETRRWIVPKGWPMRDRAPHEAAAIEALEEAGVEGDVGAQPLGAYHYLKRTAHGDVPCRVDVFPLAVAREHDHWLEHHQRARAWFSAAQAAEAVSEPELKELIERFGERFRKA